MPFTLTETYERCWDFAGIISGFDYYGA